MASPPDEQMTAAMDAIRQDVYGVHGDLNDTLLGAKQLREAVDDRQNRATRRELASVIQLLAQQQSTLDKLLEAQLPMSAPELRMRSWFEEHMCVERRGPRRHLPPPQLPKRQPRSRRPASLLPRTPKRTTHNGKPDPQFPTSPSDMHEADTQLP